MCVWGAATPPVEQSKSLFSSSARKSRFLQVHMMSLSQADIRAGRARQYYAVRNEIFFTGQKRGRGRKGAGQGRKLLRAHSASDYSRRPLITPHHTIKNLDKYCTQMPLHLDTFSTHSPQEEARYPAKLTCTKRPPRAHSIARSQLLKSGCAPPRPQECRTDTSSARRARRTRGRRATRAVRGGGGRARRRRGGGRAAGRGSRRGGFAAARAPARRDRGEGTYSAHR
jgi:hypothetical protein